MTTPEVVIACAWYNRAEYIQRTVDSLLAQEFDSFEIVIVNDGSTDPSVREILDAYDDPRLRVIHQENTGFVGAISRAIAASKAPFIAIQGSADISYPNRLRKQVSVLQSRPDVVAVGSRVDNILDLNGERKQVYGSPVDGDVSKMALTRIIMMHGEAIYRRSAYDKVGGYRPFFQFSQDRDLWCRLSREGKIVVLGDVLYRRYANIGGVSGDPKKQLIQRFLSHFAIHCHAKVLSGEADPLERYEVQAGLLYQGTLALQKDLLRLAFRYFLAGSLESAQYILREARYLRGGVTAIVAAGLLRRFPGQSEKVLRKLRKDNDAN